MKKEQTTTGSIDDKKKLYDENAAYLLEQDDKLLQEILGDLNKFKPHLQKMKKAYEDLDLGGFSDEVMTEIKESPISHFRKIFNKNIEREIEKTGIASSIIRKNMLNGLQQQFQAFESAVMAAKKYKPGGVYMDRRPYLSFEDISFKNGKFVVAKDGEEAILEKHCRVYLSTELEKNLFVAMEEFVKGHDLVRAALQQAGYTFQYRPGSQLSEIQDLLFKTDEEGWIEIKPKGIGVAVNRSAFQEEYKARAKRDAEYMRSTREVSKQVW